MCKHIKFYTMSKLMGENLTQLVNIFSLLRFVADLSMKYLQVPVTRNFRKKCQNLSARCRSEFKIATRRYNLIGGHHLKNCSYFSFHSDRYEQKIYSGFSLFRFFFRMLFTFCIYFGFYINFAKLDFFLKILFFISFNSCDTVFFHVLINKNIDKISKGRYSNFTEDNLTLT